MNQALVAEHDTSLDAASTESPAPERSSRLLVVGLVAILVVVLLRLFVAQPVLTHGDSMEPTLHDGDALVIEHVSGHFGGPAVGDIVVATSPEDGSAVVKRVVAVGGDRIGIDDGVLLRNGRAVSEPYANQDQMAGYYWGPILVPAGEVFLLGDNRLVSHDSRAYGPVSVDAITGRYVFRFWPL